MPHTLGGVRRRLMVWLVLTGFGQAVCVVGFALLAHGAAYRVTHGGEIASGHDRSALYTHVAGYAPTTLAVGLITSACATVLLKAASEPLAERLAQSYVHSIRMRLFDHVTGSEAGGPFRRTVGVTVLRFTGDASALRLWISKGVAPILVDGVFVACALVVLAVIAPVIGALSAAVILLAAAVLALLGRRLRDRVRETRRHNGRLAAFVNERVTHTAVIQSLGRVEQERRVMRRRSRDYGRAMVSQARLTGAMSATAEACGIGILLIVVTVGLVTGITWEVLASLLTVANFLGGPLLSLVRVQEHWQRSRVARRRIAEVLAAPAPLGRLRGAEPLADGPGRLELAGLRVDGVLEASAVAGPGQRIALQGPPSTGKSLLLRLIARLQDPDAGAVLLDGQDLARHDPESVRRVIRLTSPELPLLRGSVGKNLRDGEPPDAAEVADEEPVEALAELLPHGLHTRVGEGGHGLSMAMRYQVAMVRALRSGPRVLLLDEARSDALGSDLMERLLGRYPGTVIYVTDEPELAARADVLWRIEDGRLTVHEPVRPTTSSTSGRASGGSISPAQTTAPTGKPSRLTAPNLAP
ncbi:ABC transporter ATP-binding protein [Streptomyces sp. ISL-22]|uniref:ATP-binding cassette domain-containing protein n=1 Tax=unclassified Streptomyces TaxID=2593676 RepID=UPI001BE86FD5|nr:MULTISPECIES: ABC transporter ATP-binding protein [unclassified Streptomyces]MBT2419302.1 ABC transporter ATP-binding protein [Streptomyces sp. ISL-24]MBT2436798.1 ABC transporter ATP-binding protein [Streptomyces sp. ISL-22]